MGVAECFTLRVIKGCRRSGQPKTTDSQNNWRGCSIGYYVSTSVQPRNLMPSVAWHKDTKFAKRNEIIRAENVKVYRVIAHKGTEDTKKGKFGFHCIIKFSFLNSSFSFSVKWCFIKSILDLFSRFSLAQ